MSALSLRVSESLLQQTNRLAKNLSLTRAAYIKQALEAFNQTNERKLFEAELKASVAEVREQTLAAMEDFAEANEDGLNGY